MKYLKLYENFENSLLIELFLMFNDEISDYEKEEVMLSVKKIVEENK